MALKTVAEWTGSAIISSLIGMAFSYLGEHMLPADIEVELNRLNAILPKITAVLSVGEALKFQNPNSGVKEWLEQFRLAFQVAEDVLDELKYWELEQMVKNRDQVGGSFSSIASLFKRKCPGPNINKETVGRLREAVKMLDQASNGVDHFYQFVAGLDFCATSKVSSRETTSILTERNVIGRETEKAMIIEWLKRPTPHARISAFCIVGAGGLGKTTLAQLIYEDLSRENYFDKTIWACVSTIFSVKDITRKILEELGENSYDGESLNSLQKKLKEKVRSKKILFILDDVWNEDKMCDWEKLIAPVKFVQQGSKILLTTRMKSVAEMLARVLNIEREYLDLRGLDEQQLLFLLNQYAFQGYKPDHNHEKLQNIGNGIVKKLWGSPLAAKVIGSLLNSNIHFHYWEKILKCKSLINLEHAKEVTDVLKLSYYHLSAALQKCFKFCSIFHREKVFEKNTLIQMWMASGFIQQQSCGEERPEDIGEEYFNHLLKKSFFQRHSTVYKVGNYFGMHDMMYELAQNVSKEECFRAEPNNKSVNIPSTIQHVCVPDFEIERVFHLRNLRTLIITMPPWYDMPIYKDRVVLPDSLLKETLRVLVIDVNYSYELPKEIDRLIHLRLLNVNVGPGSLISNSIYKLYHLQVLELFRGIYINSDYSGVETIGMTNLVSLRYMNIPHAIMHNIHGVHKLTSLQELVFFVRQKSGHHIDELKMLKNLRCLCIKQIENVANPAEAKNANLSEKENFFSLSLNWTDGSNSDNSEEIIDKLEPHSDLRELEIEYYKGHRSPIWMRELPPLYLSSLTLLNCPLWEDLPFLAQMPLLNKLSLLGISKVKEVDYSFDMTRNACPYPSLELLICDKMLKWKSWAGLLSFRGFPKLRVLKITNCPILAELPAMPISLFRFELCNVGLYFLPEMYDNVGMTTGTTSPLNASLKVVKISCCLNLQLLNGFLQQESLEFQGIETLIIQHCDKLVQLPTSSIGKFASLKYLEIIGCPKLDPVDNERILHLVKLQTLVIGNCGELDVKLLKSASHLATLASLHIVGSATINCIPSSENTFTSLRRLHIRGCDNLIQHAVMENIQGGNPANNMASLKINELDISHHSLLFIEPIRSLRFVRECRIADCSGMEALPQHWLMQNSSTLELLTFKNARSLRSLPDTIMRLTSLKQLVIKDATSLEQMDQIPKLPPSLFQISITGAGGCELL